jgi:hypothetical protein
MNRKWPPKQQTREQLKAEAKTASPPPADMSPVLHFSEFKGYTVAEVYKINPRYLAWLYHNADCMNECQRLWASMVLGIKDYKPRKPPQTPSTEIKF